MTNRRWIFLVAMLVLNCAVYALLANVLLAWASDDSYITQIAYDFPPDDEIAETETPTPTNTLTATPTARVPSTTLPLIVTGTPPLPGFTSTPTRTPTSTQTPTPRPTTTPRPTSTPRPATLFDTLMRPFVIEALRRRDERARTDPGFARRIDAKLNQTRVNFLLFGYGETHEPPAAVDAIIGSQSIISYDLRTGRADIISLTHDTRAPEIERYLAQRGRSTPPIKIDQAYSVGGFDLMRQTVEDATGLSVDFQIALKDSMLISLVDSVYGAIEIDNPADFNVQPFYLDGKQYDQGRFAKGHLQLNGTQTIQFIKALNAVYDRSMERNVRKVIVFRGLLDGVNKRCGDGGFWLGLSSFVLGQSNSGAIQYDFDVLGLLVSNLRNVIASAGSFARGGGCDIGTSKIGKTIYVVDPNVGDGGVRWVAAEAASNAIAKRDIATGVYPQGGAGMELPINGNPYGDLIGEYWQSVRVLVKQNLSTK